MKKIPIVSFSLTHIDKSDAKSTNQKTFYSSKQVNKPYCLDLGDFETSNRNVDHKIFIAGATFVEKKLLADWMNSDGYGLDTFNQLIIT